MIWNFIDDDVVRVPRSIRREVVAPEREPKDDATEWPRVRWTLMRALSRFPEARDAVLKAIHELFSSKNEPTPECAT